MSRGRRDRLCRFDGWLRHKRGTGQHLKKTLVQTMFGDDMNDLERVRAALARVVGAPVEMMTREEWQTGLLPGGEPTLLPGPFGPYLGVKRNPGFWGDAASGDSFTEGRGGEPGFHHVRRDDKDPPEGRYNTDSHIVIVDLVSDRRWPEVVRVAGLAATPELETLARAHVFAHVQQRGDHWSPEVPDDIAGAKPKGTDDAPSAP